MIERNYRVDGFGILLNEDCILSKYYPLIPHKKTLIEKLIKNSYLTKRDCSGLTDEELMQMGITGERLIRLFRSFLKLYDVNTSKLKELNKEDMPESKRKAIAELFLLPGVRLNRAVLYYESGYVSLQEIASSTSEEMIKKQPRRLPQSNCLANRLSPKKQKHKLRLQRSLQDIQFEKRF